MSKILCAIRLHAWIYKEYTSRYCERCKRAEQQMGGSFKRVEDANDQ